MFETTITIQRPNDDGTFTQIATQVGVQVDQSSMQEVIAHQQIYNFDGRDLFKIYTLGWYATALIRRGDLLVDERNTDPETSAAFRYVVVGRPKSYQFDHQEVYAGVFVGT